jgi:hypothetical protein
MEKTGKISLIQAGKFMNRLFSTVAKSMSHRYSASSQINTILNIPFLIHSKIRARELHHM